MRESAATVARRRRCGKKVISASNLPELAQGYARPARLAKTPDRYARLGGAGAARMTRSARAAGNLRPRIDRAARILPPVEQRRNCDRLLPGRIVDLGEA